MITLYKINAPNNKVDKSGNLDNTIAKIEPINPYNDISIDNPLYILGYNPTYMVCNYLYDSVFDRYYFINNREPAPGNRLTLSCSCDYLMTFKDTIYNATATVIRNEDIGITDVIDSRLPINNNDIYVVGTLFPTQPFPETPAQSDLFPSYTNQYIMVVRN